MVYLCFGSLRFWEEVCLIRDAFARARVPRKRLFMAARYLSPGSSWKLRWKRLRWQLWQRRHKILRVAEYVPDNEVPRMFDAADAVVIVRNNSLTSGVPSLAMTFGRFVIAPNFGGIPKYLAGADNLLTTRHPRTVSSKPWSARRTWIVRRWARKNWRIADGWKEGGYYRDLPERAATKDVLKGFSIGFFERPTAEVRRLRSKMSFGPPA